MSKKSPKLTTAPKPPGSMVLAKIIQRIQTHAMTMIYLANHRDDKAKGDPKVGGHPAACSSSLHIQSLLHLLIRQPQDFLAIKPHASPIDHTNNYLLGLFLENSKKMSADRARMAMKHLRHFSTDGEPCFQSYHSAFDPDHWGFLPSGSVGIPPVNALYLSHAYEMALRHKLEVPEDAHFWALMGDSEFREGSLFEALPEASERGIGRLTWILDYNRQSLDGHRIINEDGLGSHDCDRVEGTVLANGWDCVQVRHGGFRERIFKESADGEALQSVFESALPDYELQSLLAKNDASSTVEAVKKYDKGAAKALSALDEKSVITFLRDLGGHDIEALENAFRFSKENTEKPTFIIAHTIKGWNLRCAAQSSNHSVMIEEEEVRELRNKAGLKDDNLEAFELFDPKSDEGRYLKERGEWLASGQKHCEELKARNLEKVKKEFSKYELSAENFPKEVGINTKFVPLAHTQWMLGQITAKLNRLADATLKKPEKELSESEKRWLPTAPFTTTMAPDVGTSTNLNASMDGRVFAPDSVDFESEYKIKDSKSPDIVPHEAENSRHIQFEIAEANTMSCAGSYGKAGDFWGIPFMPIMTVYDFFIKRALDQLFYNAYWKSSFILVGTPAGVSLSPEGAQHAWKSDIQIANLITWEPAYIQELDWIITESARRHFATVLEGADSPNSNEGRSAVLIRGVTRAIDQKELMKRLKKHKRYSTKSEEEILEQTRIDCLKGAYYVVDHRGAPEYRPSENVVNIFSMGCMITEALQASDNLLDEGIFANVIQVSSPDLLLGNLAEKNDYQHLRENLEIRGDLYLNLGSEKAGNGSSHYPPKQFGPEPSSIGQFFSVSGRRVPVVTVHDGEPGLLDNLGGVIGTLQKALAVRKHSKSGRPQDIYAYHGIDSKSVTNAARDLLSQSAYSDLKVTRSAIESLATPDLKL